MTIILNGENRSLEQPDNLKNLLAQWGYQSGFAVAINGDFVPRSLYESTQVDHGDDVEIVTPMKGG